MYEALLWGCGDEKPLSNLNGQSRRSCPIEFVELLPKGLKWCDIVLYEKAGRCYKVLFKHPKKLV